MLDIWPKVCIMVHSNEEKLMFKLSINERITRYLENYNKNNELQYIPVHPDDYENLLKNNELQNYSLPIVKIGEIFKLEVSH